MGERDPPRRPVSYPYNLIGSCCSTTKCHIFTGHLHNTSVLADPPAGSEGKGGRKAVPEMKKITVVGPGAMGCLLAASLARTGADVTLLDYREDRARRLQQTGIEVQEGDFTWRARPVVTADPGSIAQQDAIMILVKSYQTAAAIRPVPSICGPSTLVLSLQNGLGADDLLKALLPHAALALGTTSQGATLLEDGLVRHAGKGPTRMGLVSGGDHGARAALELLSGLMEQGGWQCEVVEDIRPYIWEKLLVNVGINALTALCCLRNGQLLHYEDAARLQEALVAEAYAVAEKEGVDLKHGLEDVLMTVKAVCKATAGNRSSMLQDRLKARPTEIDSINGAVCRLGRRLGVPTPFNEAVTRLVRVSSRAGWPQGQQNH